MEESRTHRPAENRPIQPEMIRREVRPGLVMIRRRTIKPDGRYLLYYDFERREETPPTGDSGTDSGETVG